MVSKPMNIITQIYGEIAAPRLGTSKGNGVHIWGWIIRLIAVPS